MPGKSTTVSAQPVANIEWVDRNELYANDYNPNHVAPPELKLLKTSILEDGWTQPIVARPDGEIVDGFHRWELSADPEIAKQTGGMVPVARIEPSRENQMMSTIRHNRARGQHVILRLADIVAALIKADMTEDEICALLGMEDEEVERLADSRGMTVRGSKDDFNQGWKPGG